MPIFVEAVPDVTDRVRQVILGPLVMPGQPGDTGSTDRWYVHTFDGWDDLPEAKGGLSDRPLGHGGFTPARTLRQSITATLHCWYIATDQASLQLGRQLLKSAGAEGMIRCTVLREGESRYRDVQVIRADITDDRATKRLRAAVDMEAADPRLFGPEQTIANTAAYTFLQLDNAAGTAPGSLRVVVVPQAAVSRIVLTDQATGAALTLTQSIPAGTRVEFLPAQGVALVGGLFAAGITGSWPTLPPGVAKTIAVDAGGPVLAVTAHFSPAWW